ncbi:MFS transporter [Bradyrhizobium sp. LHD-71]|uniref:MFS transporter n=1 Tax=Bradyrhizobium sp. LHD-71 TaxID=3072141 RepID=UPI00280E7D19|nr:MFS transporter [Bradyrhizobium sp. LHD-71]MDQ8730237.1 MFS transporter [Bradyrhizobium sp. LHD-71]
MSDRIRKPSIGRTSGEIFEPGPHWRPRYWSIFVGQAFSLIGSALTQFVLLWWITDTTGSVSALATAGLVALLPQALLAPFGGTLADRLSRRLLMIAADVVSALCMVVLIALFLTQQVELWHVYTMMFIRSAMQAFQAPAAAASTAMLVPQSFIPRAAGLNQTVQGLMSVAAAPLGALAISVMPIGLALGIDVLTAVLGIVPLLIYRIPQPQDPADRRTSLWGEFRAGVQLVWHDAGLLHLFGLLGAVVLVVMPTAMLVPLLVKEHFGGGAPQVAVMEALWGLGMLAGGTVVAVLAPRRFVRWTIWGFAVSCFTFAIAAVMPPALFWIALMWWTLSGVTFVMGNAPLTALLQTAVPNHLQGRVLSLLSTVMGLAGPVGLALATPLGELIGIRWLFVATGVAGGIVSLLGFFSGPLRHMDRQDRSA